MKCSVFIAASEDGYSATKKGEVGWLEQAGKPDADMSKCADMGFAQFFESVDCMIMGRKSMETLSSFDLTPEQWPYGNIPIYVLSSTITEAPDNMQNKVQMFSGEVSDLLASLTSKGLTHAYIDGGAVISAFLDKQLINEMTITRAPILLGDGIPLFGKQNKSIKLQNAQSIAYPNDFVQVKYTVSYE